MLIQETKDHAQGIKNHQDQEFIHQTIALVVFLRLNGFNDVKKQKPRKQNN